MRDAGARTAGEWPATPPQGRPRITVLGVGNILLTDEGVGVWAVQKMDAELVFPDHVRLYDGGTGGLGLLPVVEAADLLIVVDAVLVAQPPGTVVRFGFGEVPSTLTRRLSAHDTDVLDVLRVAEGRGKRPPTRIVGIQPADITSFGTEPTDARYVPRLAQAVLEELAALGVTPTRRPGGAAAQER